MAHRTTQRRNPPPQPPLPSQPNRSPPSSSTTVPISKHPKPTTTRQHHPTPNPDLISQFSKPNSNNFTLHQHFSSLNLGPNTNKPRHSKQSQITKHKHASLVDTRFQGKSMSSSAIFDSSKFSLLKPTKPETEHKRSSISKEKKPQKSKLHVLMKNEKDDESSRNHAYDGDVGINKRSCSSSVSSSSPSSSMVVAQSIRRRSSLCDSSVVDLKDVFAINGVKMISADMAPFMQIHAVDSARKCFDSMEKFTSKTLASSLKKEFDGVYGPAWHCIVGTSFGSFVTHSVGGFLYFSLNHKLYILLFKTAVQKVVN